ncbi:hypothetical protein [Mycolicibacterium xanthum]|nr:hypothetical protein [Mycolicibacterium xanthum]
MAYNLIPNLQGTSELARGKVESLVVAGNGNLDTSSPTTAD